MRDLAVLAAADANQFNTDCTKDAQWGAHAPRVVAVLVSSTESIGRLTQTPLQQRGAFQFLLRNFLLQRILKRLL